MKAQAIVFEAPQSIAVRTLELAPMGPRDVEVAVSFSGISTGTERLLWDGTMPPFPGLSYPLVPGYETVGTLCATVVVGEIPRWQDYAAMACVLLAIAAVLLPSRQARAASPS